MTFNYRIHTWDSALVHYADDLNTPNDRLPTLHQVAETIKDSLERHAATSNEEVTEDLVWVFVSTALSGVIGYALVSLLKPGTHYGINLMPADAHGQIMAVGINQDYEHFDILPTLISKADTLIRQRGIETFMRRNLRIQNAISYSDVV